MKALPIWFWTANVSRSLTAETSLTCASLLSLLFLKIFDVMLKTNFVQNRWKLAVMNTTQSCCTRGILPAQIMCCPFAHLLRSSSYISDAQGLFVMQYEIGCAYRFVASVWQVVLDASNQFQFWVCFCLVVSNKLARPLPAPCYNKSSFQNVLRPLPLNSRRA